MPETKHEPKIEPQPKIEEVKPQRDEDTVNPPLNIDLDSMNYDLKGCKICFNGQSTMINTKCRHLMMCDQCFKQMQTRQKARNEIMPCPYCATVGKYTKYIEPIYI